jgi:ABC-2 type transport system permease protein
MRGAAAVMTRELSSLFRLPVGWIAIALFVLLGSVVFLGNTLAPGEPATMRYFFAASAWALLPVAPALSMRLLSEERRSGTMEMLSTAPVGDAAVVLGKYAAAVVFLALMLVPTLVFPAVLWAVSEPAPDPGPVLVGYLGLMLVGGLYLAAGTLASALTSSQTLAFLLTLIALVLVLLATGPLADRAGPAVSEWLRAASVTERMRDFARGVLDTADAVFFASVSLWLVGLSAAATEARRWA